jgi:putative flippase GtrA
MDVERRVDGPGGGHEGLAGDLAPEHPLALHVGAVAPEDVDLDGLEVEEPDQVVDGRLSHPVILPDACSLGSTPTADCCAAEAPCTLAPVTVESSAASTAPPRGFIADKVDAIRRNGLKYMGVTVFNLIFGQTLIVIFSHLLLGNDADVNDPEHILKAALVNTLSVFISAVPAYYMSRAWVWGKRGKSELKREVLPFWIFVITGWLITTVAVAVIAAKYPTAPKFAINLASLFGFGVLWVLRFFWMDKAFHLDHHHTHGPLDVLLDEDELVEPDPA